MSRGLIVNENFPAPSVRVLRAAGVDVLSTQETMPGAADETVLEIAHNTGRWLVTFDRDYGELVFSRRCLAPPAILYLRQGAVPLTWPAERVLALLAEPELADGYLVVIEARGLRRRLLPKEPV